MRKGKPIGGFIQFQRLAIDKLEPLAKSEPEDERARLGLRLTWYQLGVLTGLCKRIGRNDTIVRHDDGKGSPMTIAEIADVIGCNRHNASKILRQLEKAGAIRIMGATSSRYVMVEPHTAHRYSTKDNG